MDPLSIVKVRNLVMKALWLDLVFQIKTPYLSNDPTWYRNATLTGRSGSNSPPLPADPRYPRPPSSSSKGALSRSESGTFPISETPPPNLDIIGKLDANKIELVHR